MPKGKNETEAQYQARLKQQRYDSSLVGGFMNNYISPLVSSVSNSLSNYTQSNLDRTDQTMQSYGYDLGKTSMNPIKEVVKKSVGGPGDPKNEIIIPQAEEVKFPEIKASTNAAQNNQNDGTTRSTSTDGGGGRLFLGSNSSVGSFMPKPKFNISPEMQSNISDISAKVDSIKSDNKIRGSKSRMGLFGNYGKNVEIRKTYDPETNKITRSKFVDGEKVEKGKGFKGVRRAKRAGGFGRKRNK